MHDRAAGSRFASKQGFIPLRSLVAHWHHFSLDRTDWRIDSLMMGTASALRRVTGFPA
jgi:hypothetical protein